MFRTRFNESLKSTNTINTGTLNVLNNPTTTTNSTGKTNPSKRIKKKSMVNVMRICSNYKRNKMLVMKKMMYKIVWWIIMRIHLIMIEYQL